MHNFRGLVENEIENIDFLIKRIKKITNMKQKGSLIKKNVSGNTYYYRQLSIKGKKYQMYLGTRNDENVDFFKLNYFNLKRIALLEHNKKLLKNLLLKYRSDIPNDVKKSLPRIYGDLSENFIDQVWRDKGVGNLTEASDWTYGNYDRNPYEFDDRASVACDGTRVRSKGECIWYEALLRAGIPFRYEEKLELIDENGNIVVLYPDFAIKCLDGSRIYIEHIGLLQNDTYGKNFLRKIRLYQLNNIVIGDNLVLTSDNKRSAINSSMISSFIKFIITPLAVAAE